jgi:hypothetical protein
LGDQRLLKPIFGGAALKPYSDFAATRMADGPGQRDRQMAETRRAL